MESLWKKTTQKPNKNRQTKKQQKTNKKDKQHSIRGNTWRFGTTVPVGMRTKQSLPSRAELMACSWLWRNSLKPKMLWNMALSSLLCSKCSPSNSPVAPSSLSDEPNIGTYGSGTDTWPVHKWKFHCQVLLCVLIYCLLTIINSTLKGVIPPPSSSPNQKTNPCSITAPSLY